MKREKQGSQQRVARERDHVSQSPHHDLIRHLLQCRWTAPAVYAHLCAEFGPGFPYPKDVAEESIWNNFLIPSQKSIQRYAQEMKLEALRDMTGSADRAALPRASAMYFAWRDAVTGTWKMWIALTEE